MKIGMGDTISCDQDNNCYDATSGVYTPAPVSNLSYLSTSASISDNASIVGNFLSENSAMIVAGVAILGLFLSRGRR